MTINTATALFLDYVAEFQPNTHENDSNEPRRTPIDVKREHSLAVLENARRILQGLAICPWLENMGLLAALFHDVGRFPQYQRFGTFHDPCSVNHGLLGARTLAPAPQGRGLLDALPFRERSMVRAVVAMHNRRFVPSGISPELLFLTDLVRDADKLDIMRVMITHFTTEKHNPVLTLNVKPHPENYTQNMYNNVLTGSESDYRKMRWTNDFKLMLLGWVRHLNFRGSRELIVERGVLQSLWEIMPETSAMRELEKRVQEFLQEDLARPERSAPEGFEADRAN